MHLFGGPVEYRNEERMASDNSGQSVHILGFTSRDIKKLTVSAVLVCVCLPGRGCGRPEDSSSVNPVVLGF